MTNSISRWPNISWNDDMSESVLITCRLVWADEKEVGERLAEHGLKMAMPRFDGQQLGEDELLDLLPPHDAILAGDDHLTRRVLEACPRLEVISKWGIGVDAIDRAAAEELGIEVFNTPGVFGDELADYAMGYIHLLARRQHEVDRGVRAGEWTKIQGRSLSGLTLGVVGLGSSGSALARRARASGMTVLGFDVRDVDTDANFEVVTLERLLSESDVISLHLPVTDETRHMVNSKTLAAMKPGVWVVNTSRGALVDEPALLESLRSGNVGAAALDVFEEEPVSPSNPLLREPNVILGSHNGSNTAEAVARTTWRAVDNVLRGLGHIE